MANKKAEKEIEGHEAANVFPMMGEEELQTLTDDMRKNGQREAIVTYQGKILDGRNRYKAGRRLQGQDFPIILKFREWDGKGSAVAYVVSLNLHRRHLNESQRAMIAETLSNTTKGRQKKNASIEAFSQDKAADLLNVSRSAVQRAAKVSRDGGPELINAVRSGEMSVAAASQAVDATKKYPEVAAIKGARPQDRLTIASNLDKLSEREREEKLKLLSKGDSDTLTSLANKPPMPKPKPASSFDRWDEHLDKVERTFIDLERVTEQLMGEWDSDEKQRFLSKIGDIQAQLTAIESTTLRSMDYDGTAEGRESATTIH